MRSAVAFLFAFSCFAFAQNLPTSLKAPSGTLEHVLYVGDQANLYTYNIDPKTFQPTLMGTIPLPKTQLNGIAASSDGKFLYVMASDPYPATNNRIYVYDTTGYGVPGMPIQSVAATYQGSMFVHPSGRFLYDVRMGTHVDTQQNLAWSIYRYEVNPADGRLTSVVNEATYHLPAQGTNYCSLAIAAMNIIGTKIFNNVFCGTHAGLNGWDDERILDPQTGALGASSQIFSWSANSIGAQDSVQIMHGLLFAFAVPIAGQPYNNLQIFRVSANPNAKPLIDCTSTMLAACATDSGVAHPSAKYVFFTNTQSNTTEVDAVDLSSKQIVPTGTTFPTATPNVLKFTPDGSVLYSWDWQTSTISIFGFDASTAAITPGGEISGKYLSPLLATERR